MSRFNIKSRLEAMEQITKATNQAQIAQIWEERATTIKKLCYQFF